MRRTYATFSNRQVCASCLKFRRLGDRKHRCAKGSEKFEGAFVVDGKSILISPRVGIAAYPEHGSTANELFSHSELSVHDAEIYNTASEASLARGTVV